uniref:Inhibitor I9 domain-containing protein n=1 Tax=Glycine max TaxID=3847 RepID=C6TB80_SOYBN|nr:unknown [Glycine max]
MVTSNTNNTILKISKLAILLVLFASVCNVAMSDSTAKPLDQHATTGSDPTAPAVHIVYTERPQNEEPEAYHIRTLTSVLGSGEAAKEALLYSYKSAASGFSAKLTPEQVEQISKLPGVLQVVPSRTYQLHGPNNLQ